MNRPPATMNPDRTDRYLFVKHSENWNVDRCTRWMSSHGVPVDWCYPASEQPFPDPAGYAGVIVFGGAGSANDCGDFAWVRDELRFIERALDVQVPFFGICLGAQMLARVLGARVAPHPDGLVEIGFHEVRPTPASPGFLDAPLTVMQWHTEGFELPPDTTRIATAEGFGNQGFRVNETTLGVQFHPEVNPEALAIWHARNRERRPGQLSDDDRETMMADAHRHAAATDAWLDAFLGGWTRRAARAA